MNKIYNFGILLALLTTITSCNGQSRETNKTSYDKTKRVGGECEAGYCELMYAGIPEEINSIDTSAGWYEKGQKLLVTGTVFQIDGRTPESNVIIYYHQTDNDGYYSPRYDKPENQTRHGHIRGWVKTDENGKYEIYTTRPAPYPNTDLPAHIHLMIKEPDIGNEYWIEDINFDDDQLLMPFLKNQSTEKRGGSGIVNVILKDDLQIAEHNIVLGLNIPNYPEE